MLFSADEFEHYTGVFGDSLAASHLKSAQEIVENYLHFNLESKDYITKSISTGRAYVRAKARPITELRSVKINGESLPIEDFVFCNEYVYRTAQNFPNSAIVEMEYTAGFTADTIPEIIKTTVWQIAALRQIESGQNIGVSSKSFGDSGSRVFLSTRKYDDFLINCSKFKFK